MISVQGTVAVRTINGRNGDFNVGRLQTEIGEFNVKEGIEEYDPGTYTGTFVISRIYPASYQYGGRFNIEIRAVVNSIALTDIDDDIPEDEPVAEAEPDKELSQLPSEDKDLFGSLWPLEDSLKLDPTVERELLSRQAARLKVLGYKFQPIGRAWCKTQSDASGND